MFAFSPDTRKNVHSMRKILIPDLGLSVLVGWILFASPLLLTIINSYFGISSYDSVSGFPFKDAGAWANCIKALAISGDFTEGYGQWCLRRPLFPEMTSLFYVFTNSLFIVSLVLSLLFGVAIRMLFLEVVRFSSFLIASFVSIFAILYWYIYCCNQILTEALASTVCLTGLVFLVKAFATHSNKHIFLSIALFGLSQQIRPGNLFLPLVPILLLRNKSDHRNRFSVLQGFLVFLAPYVVALVSGKILKIEHYGNSGNAWASLYGLANGNSSWSSAYAIPDIPLGATDAEISRSIKNATISLISDNPFEVVRSISLNFIHMTTSFFPFVSPVSIPSLGFALAMNLLVIGFVFTRTFQLVKSREIKTPVFSVVYAIIISTLLSYAIAWKSEPARALMPSLPVFLLAICILGFSNYHPEINSVDPNSLLVNKSDRVLVRRSLLPTCALLISVFGLVLLSHQKEHLGLNFKPLNCATGEFSLVPKSLTIVDSSKIRSFSLFSWSGDVELLKGGKLFQGLSFGDGRYSSFNGFIKGTISQSDFATSCFLLEESQAQLGSFSDSGVRSFNFSTKLRNN